MKRVVVMLLVLAAGVASAQVGDEKAAEDFFNKGNTAYNLGHFDEAVTWFTKAYEAWAQPEFLYNIAQSYRLGGNCKQALFFYKRFVSVKEKEGSPLSAKKKAEIDKFIVELQDCANKTDGAAAGKPDTVVKPSGTGTGTGTGTATKPTTGTTTTGTTTTGTTTTGTTTTGTTTTGTTTTATTRPTTGTTTTTTATAKLENPDGEEEEHVEANATEKPIINARVTGGVALLGSGDLNIPIQPTVGIAGGYPLALGSMTLDFGAGVSWSPLPYTAMGASKQGMMIGGRAIVGDTFAVAPKISLRGELGVGILSLSGLGDGNPLTTMRQAASFTLPNVRVGVAAEYAFTPNVLATIAPAFGYSPGASGMYASSLTEIDVVLGVGYRK